jgi:hypothetical protein
MTCHSERSEESAFGWGIAALCHYSVIPAKHNTRLSMLQLLIDKEELPGFFAPTSRGSE